MKKFDIDSFDLSTRRKRRGTMAFIISLLTRIKASEERFISKVPENFKENDTVFSADLSIDCILEAIDILMEAY
jgi:hypothetical protein